MGIKADLAVELKLALAEGAGPNDLGGWIVRNAEQVAQALEAADDLVEIRHINLCDIPRLLNEQAPA